MKRKTIVLGLVVALILATTAQAFSTRATAAAPKLVFDNGNAICSIRILSAGKAIDVTMTLLDGNTRVASWSKSGQNYVLMEESAAVSKGHTYTLKVTGTVDGEPIVCSPTEKTYK